MITNNNGTPNSQAAPSSGRNGDSPALSGQAMLAQLVARAEGPASPDSDPSPLPPAQGDPANLQPPVDEDQTGQDNLSPAVAEPPANAADAAGAGGQAGGTDLSQNTEFNEALNGLNADARKHLMEMAQAVAKGETSIGELKRGHKLTATIEQLKREFEEKLAQMGSGNGAAGAGGPPPGAEGAHPAVANVKSDADVVKTHQFFKELKRWCGRNPEGGVFQSSVAGYQRLEVQGAEVTGYQDMAEDVIDTHLPHRVAQLRSASDFVQQQQAARKQTFTDFPILEDETNPVTQLARTFLKQPEIARQKDADYIAACLAKGHLALQEEKAKRTPGNNGTHRPASTPGGAVPGPGKVPLGKPHSAPGTVPPRLNGQPSVQTALNSVRENGSRHALGNLINAMNR